MSAVNRVFLKKVNLKYKNELDIILFRTIYFWEYHVDEINKPSRDYRKQKNQNTHKNS